MSEKRECSTCRCEGVSCFNGVLESYEDRFDCATEDNYPFWKTKRSCVNCWYKVTCEECLNCVKKSNWRE
jgi:hypothetical protein